MAITSLSDVTNEYGSYRGNSLVGPRGSVGTVPNDGLEGIVGKNLPFLNGILLKIGGTIYTDQGYLNALKTAGNPYISKRSLPVVSLRLSDLTAELPETIVYEGTTRTKYAEANVTKRMSTIDDILNYLNDFFNPNTSDTTLDPLTIGGWELTTSEYNVDLDVAGEYPGLQFEESGLGIKISTPPTSQTPKEPEPVPVVEIEPEKEIEIIKPKLDTLDFSNIVIPPLDLSDFKLDPIDLDFSDFDFGFGNINTDFGYGLGGDISVSNPNLTRGSGISNDGFGFSNNRDDNITLSSERFGGFTF